MRAIWFPLSTCFQIKIKTTVKICQNKNGKMKNKTIGMFHIFPPFYFIWSVYFLLFSSRKFLQNHHHHRWRWCVTGCSLKQVFFSNEQKTNFQEYLIGSSERKIERNRESIGNQRNSFCYFKSGAVRIHSLLEFHGRKILFYFFSAAKVFPPLLLYHHHHCYYNYYYYYTRRSTISVVLLIAPTFFFALLYNRCEKRTGTHFPPKNGE